MTTRTPQKRVPHIADFDRYREEATIERMEQRLADGFDLIERRRHAGLDVEKLEQFWLELLHQYEAICNARPMAA